MNTKQKNIDENDVFNIKNTVKKFINNWKIYLISVLIFIGLGVLFILAVTPMYEIDAQILVQDEDSRSNTSSFLNPTAMADFGNCLEYSLMYTMKLRFLTLKIF